MSQAALLPLPYDPDALPRETARHYIPATDQDLQAMLGTGLQSSYMLGPKGTEEKSKNPLRFTFGSNWPIRHFPGRHSFQREISC